MNAIKPHEQVQEAAAQDRETQAESATDKTTDTAGTGEAVENIKDKTGEIVPDDTEHQPI